MRYGIAEWYGHDAHALAAETRRKLAAAALGDAPREPCPFVGRTCSKKGGVCAIGPVSEDGAPAGAPVIVCPKRFEEGGLVLRWLADIVGFGARSARIAREVPFMVSTTTNVAAGRIDIVLAETNGELAWFGLEVQAVYFSGPGMDEDFRAHRDAGASPYPTAVRRPDWRSSSAKRLAPQLQVKGPTLRRWGSKLAVAVDAPFFEAIGGASAQPSQDLADGDVLWLVPELRGGRLRRGHWEVLTLEASTEKLLAARTVRKPDFEETLRRKLEPLPWST